MEYAQLNHETDHHIVQEDHGDHDVQDDHTGNSVDSTTADHGE